MKKLFALLVIASLGLFTIGCGGEPAKVDTKKAGGTTKTEDKKTEDKMEGETKTDLPVTDPPSTDTPADPLKSDTPADPKPDGDK